MERRAGLCNVILEQRWGEIVGKEERKRLSKTLGWLGLAWVLSVFYCYGSRSDK